MCLSDASNLHAKRYNDVVCHLIQKANNEIQYGGEKYLSWEGLVDQNTRGSHFILTFLSIWVYRLKIFNQCCAVHGSALHNSEYCFDCRTQGGVHFGRPFISNSINSLINNPLTWDFPTFFAEIFCFTLNEIVTVYFKLISSRILQYIYYIPIRRKFFWVVKNIA